MKYYYKIEVEPDSTLSISFLDFPQCFTQADDISQAHMMASDVLHGVLETLVELGEFIPEPVERPEEGLHYVVVDKDTAKKVLASKMAYLQKELEALEA